MPLAAGEKPETPARAAASLPGRGRSCYLELLHARLGGPRLEAGGWRELRTGRCLPRFQEVGSRSQGGRCCLGEPWPEFSRPLGLLLI